MTISPSSIAAATEAARALPFDALANSCPLAGPWSATITGWPPAIRFRATCLPIFPSPMIAVFMSLHSFVRGGLTATQEIEIQSIRLDNHRRGVRIVKPPETENGLLAGEIMARRTHG